MRNSFPFHHLYFLFMWKSSFDMSDGISKRGQLAQITQLHQNWIVSILGCQSTLECPWINRTNTLLVPTAKEYENGVRGQDYFFHTLITWLKSLKSRAHLFNERAGFQKSFCKPHVFSIIPIFHWAVFLNNK